MAILDFSQFSFHESVMEGLDAMNFHKPTPIQEQAIPLILESHDLIACAQTGTGKTAAFILPILHKIAVAHAQPVNTLVIVPTRELAIQIDQAIQGFAYFTHASSICIYGGNDGSSFEQEKKALIEGAHVIIATPGRLIAHLNMGYAKLQNLQHLVLDEADRMLDMGFADDINKITSHLPKKRQTLLFSATMPPKIRDLAKRILHNPSQINIAVSKPASGVMQGAYFVHDTQKTPLLIQLLQGRNLKSVIIFTSRKTTAKELGRTLQRAGFAASAIHSDLEQQERNEVLRQFKNKSLALLVATDILSRGIDIDSIELVINYDVPHDAEDYVHRVGRTARAENTGIALTLINPLERKKFSRIEELIETEVRKFPLPETIASIAAPAASKTDRPHRSKRPPHKH